MDHYINFDYNLININYMNSTQNLNHTLRSANYLRMSQFYSKICTAT